MKVLELTDTFIKVEGYKVNTEYKKNKQIEREIGVAIPFITTLDKNKEKEIPWSKIIKDIKDLIMKL